MARVGLGLGGRLWLGGGLGLRRGLGLGGSSGGALGLVEEEQAEMKYSQSGGHHHHSPSSPHKFGNKLPPHGPIVSGWLTVE